jgi:DNA modification methylase
MHTELLIEVLPLVKLVPYARNARTHSEAQVAQIAGSIREFGFTNPVLIDAADGIIAGHGRVMAARALGLSDVPCIRLAHLTETQRRAYVLADNRIALNSGWDADMLALEVDSLIGDDFDLSLLGFDDAELAALLNQPTDGLTDPDEVPEPPAVPVAAPGDVWLLGNHRLACGSCTDAHTVEALLAGALPHLMVTDPPYGVEYDAEWRNEAKRPDGRAYGAFGVGVVENDNIADWRDAWALFSGDVAYVWHASLMTAPVFDSLVSCNFVPRAHLIWAKSSLAISRGHYHWQHEPCWYAVRKGATGHWTGDRKQSTLWQIPKPQKSETGHSTQKPIECMKRPIENNSAPGDAVYEPFSGSGTTIIAAEMTGRRCYAVELNPAYVDVAVRRWQDFAGREATLEGDGRTFAQLTEHRSPS